MALAQAPLARHRRLAYRLKRGRLAAEAVADCLPGASLDEAALSNLLHQAWASSHTDPHIGLAIANVARAEAQRLGAPVFLAFADYRLATCLIWVDEWAKALQQVRRARQQFARLGMTVEVAHCDWHAAYAYRFLAEYGRGAALAARCEKVFRRHKLDRWQGRALLERARNLNQLGQLQESGRALRLARQLFERSHDRAQLALCDLAEAARLSHGAQDAAALPQAEHAWLELRRLGRAVDAAWAEFQYGYIACELRQFDQATESLERAARSFQRLGLPLRRALTLNQLGATLVNQGHFVRAQPVLEQAVATFQHFQPGGFYEGLARTNLGYTAIMTGDLSAAEQHFESARSALARPERARWLASVEAGLGYLYLQQGKFDHAISRLEEAIRVWRAEGDEHRVAMAREDLAGLFLLVGDAAAGESLLRDCLVYYQNGQRPVDVARAQIELARACLAGGRPAEALPLLQEAGVAAHQVNSDWLGARVEFALGDALAMLGSFDDADYHLGVAAALFETQRLYSERAEAGLRRAEVWFLRGTRDSDGRLRNGGDGGTPALAAGASVNAAGGMKAAKPPPAPAHPPPLDPGQAEGGRFSEGLCPSSGQSFARAGARELLESAFAGWSHALPELEWRYHFLKARLEVDPVEAMREYKAAIAALQSARRSLSREELSAAYLAGRREVFDRALSLAVCLRQPEAALELSEESRAQALAGQLRRPPAQPGAPKPDSPAVRRRSRARTQLRLWRQQAAGRDDAVPGGSWQAQAGPEELLEEYIEASAAVQREACFSLNDPAGWAPFTWSAFSQRAGKFLPDGWLGLAYQPLGDALVVFEFGASGVALRTIDLASAGLGGLRNGAARFATDRNSQLLRREGQELRRQFYDLLIPASTAEQLRPDGLLLILPCGSLSSLPFHALQAPDGRYLVEQTVVSYAPSLLTLDLLSSRRSTAPAASRPRRGSLCLVAHAGMNAAEPHGRFKEGATPLHPAKPAADADGQAALPAARLEVEGLLGTFGSRAFCLQDGQATAAALSKMSRDGRLKRFEYVHLLAHGRFDERRSRGSGLTLADGGLLVDDVADLQLSARVVTLSTCEAGMREVFPGEEWVGLTQAFLAAGADCVVSGLWRVPDASMPWPMRLYYQNMLRGMSPAAALCLAQRRSIGLYREPYRWAALVAVGLP